MFSARFDSGRVGTKLPTLRALFLIRKDLTKAQEQELLGERARTQTGRALPARGDQTSLSAGSGPVPSTGFDGGVATAHSLDSPTDLAVQGCCGAHAGALAATEAAPVRAQHPHRCGLGKRSDSMGRWKPQPMLTSRGEADVQGQGCLASFTTAQQPASYLLRLMESPHPYRASHRFSS